MEKQPVPTSAKAASEKPIAQNPLRKFLSQVVNSSTRDEYGNPNVHGIISTYKQAQAVHIFGPSSATFGNTEEETSPISENK